MKHTTLNLGSGRDRLPEALNVDSVPDVNPDLVHDLNATPWPMPDNTFAHVIAKDVIEHLDDVVRTMKEIHRVSRPDAVVHITLPHFSCANAFRDPTHRHYFSRFSFDYFTDQSRLSFYSDVRFEIRSAVIRFYPTLLNKIIWRFANRYPERYEQRWAWIFPAWYLDFELAASKNEPPSTL